jgi:hypothetical protein
MQRGESIWLYHESTKIFRQKKKTFGEKQRGESKIVMISILTRFLIIVCFTLVDAY